MARKFENDNDFFRAQYSRGPFGAEQAIPVVRRNGSEVLFTAKGQPYIIEIKNGRKRARFIKKSQAAQENPWFGALFLPDTTVRREALVPASTPYFDATQTRSALVGGKYAWNNPTKAASRRAKARRSAYAAAGGKFCDFCGSKNEVMHVVEEDGEEYNTCLMCDIKDRARERDVNPDAYPTGLYGRYNPTKAASRRAKARQSALVSSSGHICDSCGSRYDVRPAGVDEDGEPLYLCPKPKCRYKFSKERIEEADREWRRRAHEPHAVIFSNPTKAASRRAASRYASHPCEEWVRDDSGFHRCDQRSTRKLVQTTEFGPEVTYYCDGHAETAARKFADELRVRHPLKKLVPV